VRLGTPIQAKADKADYGRAVVIHRRETALRGSGVSTGWLHAIDVSTLSTLCSRG
jgi:hypothetical protein